MMLSWVESELKAFSCGDKRLDRRAKLCISQFARIAESTPDACQGVAESEATYRLVKNPKVRTMEIFAEHNRSTVDRTSQESCVFLIQDTTVFDLTKPTRQVRGAGPIEREQRRGFFYHPLYAVSGEGLVLGVADQVVWTRGELEVGLTKAAKEKQRKAASFEEKESSRWLEMQQSGEQIARSNPQTTYISMGDSEADIHELLCDTSSFSENYHLLIRACQPRAIRAAAVLDGSGSLQPIPEVTSLDEALAKAEVRYQKQVDVGARTSLIAGETHARKKSREARVATISVRAVTVIIRGPARPGGKLPDVRLNVVEGVEENPPPGAEPIRWVLLTTLPIGTLEEIAFVLDSYCLRWLIELFFKTLKGGLQIEKLKYHTLDAYLTAFSMLSIVAWRIEHLKSAVRAAPEASCQTYFTSEQWIPVYLYATKKTSVPETPPTVNEFLLLVAKLGGYLYRKSKGPPGSKTIWRGMRRVEVIIEAFQTFRKSLL
jgi:hypothetical protein